MLQRLKNWAVTLKREVMVLWFACRDPRTPWYARVLTMLIVAYAFSPIDLIPDFIPVLGYLDELILLPVGIYLVLKLVPAQALTDARARAQSWVESRQPKPRNWIAAAVIVLVWVTLLWAAFLLIWPTFFLD
ncbi:MAG TPA: YkvA family protein [Burkholderiales bacterium]|nr:YkvA family protein [Burkholderiales bacterium]